MELMDSDLHRVLQSQQVSILIWSDSYLQLLNYDIHYYIHIQLFVDFNWKSFSTLYASVIMWSEIFTW